MRTKNLTLVILAVMLSQILVGTTGAVAGSAWKNNVSAIKQERGPIWVTIPSASTVLGSISVTSPYNGYVMVTATGTVGFNHTAGNQGFYCLDLSDT